MGNGQTRELPVLFWPKTDVPENNSGRELFLTFSALVANPKKLLYTVANPACGLLNREKKKKEKVWQRPPPPRAVRSEKNKK